MNVNRVKCKSVRHRMHLLHFYNYFNHNCKSDESRATVLPISDQFMNRNPTYISLVSFGNCHL